MDRRVILAAVLVAATVFLYFFGLPKPEPSPPEPQSSQAASPAAVKPVPRTPQASATPADSKKAAAQSAPVDQAKGNILSAKDAPAAPADVPPSAPEPEESLSSIDPIQDVEEVRRMVRGYRDVLGENPTGTNAEITRALTGGNLKQVKMPVPRGSSVGESGELVDRWGTPYFFHQLSAEEMEVRSAGPDRVMWTADDHQVE